MDREVLEAFAVAGAAEAFFEPRPVLFHGARHETHGQPAVGDLGGELDRRFVAGRQVDRDVRVHVQDGFQRLADSHGAGPGVGQRDLAAVVRHGRLAGEDLAHDRDIVADAPIGLAPRLAVPTLDDLRARNTQANDEAAAAGHRVDGRRRHRRVRRCARGQLHDPGAELDAAGVRRQEGERRHGVRTVGLGRPHRVVAQLLGALHELHRNVDMGAGIADRQAQFHRGFRGDGFAGR